MIQIFKGRNIYDLHDLHDLCDLAHVARREPYNLHDLLKHMFTKFELNYTDPAKGITTVVQDLDDVDDVDDVDYLDNVDADDILSEYTQALQYLIIFQPPFYPVYYVPIGAEKAYLVLHICITYICIYIEG